MRLKDSGVVLNKSQFNRKNQQKKISFQKLTFTPRKKKET